MIQSPRPYRAQALMPLVLHSRLTSVCLMLWFASFVNDGVLRFGLVTVGCPWLIYLRDAFLAALFVVAVLSCGVSRPLAVACLAVAVASAAGMVFIGHPLQVAFGAKIILPFLVGVVLASIRVENVGSFRTGLWVIFLIHGASIVANCFVEYPWAGTSYEVGGYSIEANRKWFALGYSRIAGFSRFSFNAAEFQFLMGAYLLLTSRRRVAGLLAWGCALGAIALTTSKGPSLAAVIVTMLMLANLFFRGQRALLWSTSVAGCTALAACSILLPAAGPGLGKALTTASWKWLTFSTLLDRIHPIWPTAMHMALAHGNPLTGRGLGGVGNAQLYFEPNWYTPADNLFVWLVVEFGIAWAVAIPFMLAIRAARFTQADDGLTCFLGYVALGCLSLGVTTNVVENPVLALLMGYTIAADRGPQRDRRAVQLAAEQVTEPTSMIGTRPLQPLH